MQLIKTIIPGLSDFVYTLDNTASTTTAKKYIIGDMTKIIQNVLAGTYASPDLLNGSAEIVEPNKQAFLNAIRFKMIYVEANTSSIQLSSQLSFIQANSIGNLKTTNINVTVPNLASNDKKAEIPSDFQINSLSALTYSVNAGEKVSITLVPFNQSDIILS